MKDTRVGGSLKDPSGYVILRADRIYRAIDTPCFQILSDLYQEGLLSNFIDDGRIVKTDFVKDASLCRTLTEENPGFENFLEHEVLPTITYPYEWSTSMAIFPLSDAKKYSCSVSGYSNRWTYPVLVVQS